MSFNFFSLDYIYYPVSGIMWIWHKVFGFLLGNNSAWAWVLSVVFLVFTLRAILFKPFMKQMDSQLQMQAVQPEMKKLREKYKDDRQRLTEEMMKLNKEAGVNPLASCLPALMQAPVFIGLYHVLRSFQSVPNTNYFFPHSDVISFTQAKLFGGAQLSAHMAMSTQQLAQIGADRTTMIWVGIPLTILAGIATHLTSRKSVARQTQLGSAATGGQAAIMQKLMLYVFPLFVIVGGPFFPLAILFYWLSNNTWTFGQLWAAHRIQDRKNTAQAQVVEAAKDDTRFSTPKPGAKPRDPKRPLVQPTQVTSTDTVRTPPGPTAKTSGGTDATPPGNGAAGKQPGPAKRRASGQQGASDLGVSSDEGAQRGAGAKDGSAAGALPPGTISQSQPQSQRPSQPAGNGSATRKPNRSKKKGRR